MNQNIVNNPLSAERRDIFLIGKVGAKRDLLLLRLRLGLARRRGQHDPTDVDGALEVVAGRGQQPVLLPADEGGLGLGLLSPRRLGDDDRMHLQRTRSVHAAYVQCHAVYMHTCTYHI